MKKNLIKFIAISLIAMSLNACGGGGSSASPSELDAKYSYTQNDLGVNYNSDKSITVKVWSPTVKSASVMFYNKSNASQLLGNIDLILNEETGVWEKTITPSEIEGIDDFKGYLYQFKIGDRLALDPYAKSMYEFRVNTSGNSADKDTVGKAAIIDFSSLTQVNNFANIKGFGADGSLNYQKREDAIIWEIHIRDFTVDPYIEDTLNGKPFGTYTAFIEKLDYIKSLGVTHIQLLPVMSYYYGDEALARNREMNYNAQGNNYNWGYDPHSYFAPEGMYSSNPKDAELRINELKELINAIHDSGMGVILDVVYNHTADMQILNNVVPGYFYRTQSNSGCGNDVATERAMARKLIVDSLLFWTNEYKVDGFRFDLMGIIDSETMNEAYSKVSAINPNSLFVGEGWRLYSGPSTIPGATQDYMNKTDGYSCFSDEIRNELKSGYGSEGEPRFITGGARKIETIFNNIKAQPSNMNEDDPGDVVQYIAAHDNLTLHDVIAQSIKKSSENAEEEIQKRIRLGNAIILTSQGTAFLHAGQEYGRTKKWNTTGNPSGEYTKTSAGEIFIHNSYDASDIINKFDWETVTTDTIQKRTMEYTKGLIAIRKSSDAFRLGTKNLVDSNVTLISSDSIKTDDLVIAYKCKSTTNEEFYIFINADEKERTINLDIDLTNAKVLADSETAGVSEIASPKGVKIEKSSIQLEPLTVLILKK